jgi:hypothetical protein
VTCSLLWLPGSALISAITPSSANRMAIMMMCSKPNLTSLIGGNSSCMVGRNFS